jgi:hypothetical protein
MSGRKWPVQDPTFIKDTTAGLGACTGLLRVPQIISLAY